VLRVESWELKVESCGVVGLRVEGEILS